MQILSNIFCEKSSPFKIRRKCLDLTTKEDEYYFLYAGVVNWECKKFKLEELSPDRFKCLICGNLFRNW